MIDRRDDTKPFPREAIVLGLIVAVLVGLALALGAARSGSGYLINSDAKYSLKVAMDPFGRGHTFAGEPADVGVAYRYGRILYPFLAWALALGRSSLVEWTMPVVYAASLGLMAACACALVASRGGSPVRGLWVLLAPAMFVTIPIVFSDPVFVALALLVYVLDVRGHRLATYVAAAAMLLAREAAVLALVPLVWRDVRRRDARAVSSWALSVVPLVAWWAWVRARIGYWPPLDPAYGRRGALSWPLNGLITVIREGKPVSGWFLAAIIAGVITMAAGIYVWRRVRWHPVTDAAFWFSLLIGLLGPSAVRLPAQMLRLMLPAQVFIVLAFVSTIKRGSKTVETTQGSLKPMVASEPGRGPAAVAEPPRR